MTASAIGRSPAWLATACVLLLACGAPETSGQTAAAASEAAELAPDFTLPDLEGRDIQLSAHRGKVVIVDFWATWCPPCVFQVPELNKLWEAHHKGEADVMVIGVAVDVEGAEVVGPWIQEQDVRYPIVIGDEELAREFGALGFPTLAIITPSGHIDSLHVGLIEIDELEELVAPFVPTGT